MRRFMTVLGLLLACCTVVLAQDEESLTREFPNLSARERSRIAEREAAEAPRDAAFQAVMRTADELFQAGRYEESLERYLEARRMRPYNVYPKVKAQDLQALLERRAAEARHRLVASSPDVTIAEVGPQHAVIEAEPVLDATVRPVPPVVVEEMPDTGEQALDLTDAMETPSDDVEEGLVERRYREGRADVLERRLTRGGQTITYRRVRHPWGAVFHFKDGEAISATAWEQAFPREGD